MSVNSDAETVRRWIELDRVFSGVSPGGAVSYDTILKRLGHSVAERETNAKTLKKRITRDMEDFRELGIRFKRQEIKVETGLPKEVLWRYEEDTLPLFTCNLKHCRWRWKQLLKVLRQVPRK